MSSNHRYRSSSDESSDSYSSSNASSEYHSRHRRKKKKKSKHSKKMDRDRKRHKKHRKSKHEKKSKSRRKHSKHRSKKKRRHNDDTDTASNTNIHEPKHKKRKLHHSEHTKDPCTSMTSLTDKEMMNNAKTVLAMFCENDSTKDHVRNIFNKLDHNQSVSISDEDPSYQQPLKMIFTFLSLTTNNELTYTKSTTDYRTLTDLFKNELQTSVKPIFIGPSGPPSDYKQSETTETKEVPSSDIIGVTMPTKEDLLNNKYSSEEDDDTYGPAVNNTDDTDQKRVLQMQHSKIYAEMNQKIKGDEADINKDNEKREEWMTTMPTSFLSDFEKGTKNRVFNTTDQKLDDTWTKTPNEVKKQKKEMKRIKQIESETDAKLKLLGLPTVEKQAELLNNREVEQVPVMERVHVGKKRKSLFDEHQEKLMKEYKEELKEWKSRKKSGEKVGQKPVFKGVAQHDASTNYTGSMDSYYKANNPTFSRSKLNTFVSGGTIDDY